MAGRELTDEKHFHPMVIERSRGWSSIGLKEMWEYRELVFHLVLRETQGIYRQTALGVSWLFLRPVINMLILSLVFGSLVKVPSDEFPYPLFSLSALIPWGYFSNAVVRTSRSLVDNLHIVSKVYFPRMILPLAASISGIWDFLGSLLIFFIAMLFYRYPFRWEMLWLPALFIITIAFALAFGLWLATLSVKYRDVSFAVNFILQALMYASPVIYSVSMVPGPLRVIYQLNPMSGVIQGFRWALLGGEAPGTLFFISTGIVFVLLFSGMYVFRRTERGIVDLL